MWSTSSPPSPCNDGCKEPSYSCSEKSDAGLVVLETVSTSHCHLSLPSAITTSQMYLPLSRHHQSLARHMVLPLSLAPIVSTSHVHISLATISHYNVTDVSLSLSAPPIVSTSHGAAPLSLARTYHYQVTCTYLSPSCPFFSFTSGVLTYIYTSNNRSIS